MKTLASLLLCITAIAAAAQNAKLNLFIWSEYIDPGVVADFEKVTHSKVEIDLYEDSESMLAKVQNGGGAIYDIVVVTDNMIPVMTKQGLLAPLRHEKIPNLKNLEERFRNPPYDPGNRFTAAYQWGTVGVLYRTLQAKPAPDSWAVFFDPQRQSGSFLLMDSVRDTVGAALKFKGYSVNSTDPKQLREARDLLIEAKSRSTGFDGSVGVKNKILSKTAQAGIVYSGEGVRAALENKQLAYMVPKEGSIIWVDNLVVLAKARHRELAEQFIDFVLDSHVGARISKFTQFSTPNEGSKKLLPREDLANEVIYPGPETLHRLEFLQDLGSKTRIYDEVWTQVKAR
jgi:spermidine/putrescine transport system substrate-binding protein